MTDHPSLPESVVDLMNTNWRFFKVHQPVGAYLPVGQLDGDCHECGGSWPCQPMQHMLASLFVTSDALATEHRKSLASVWSAWLDLAMSTRLGTPDNPEESVLGTVLALNPDLRERFREALGL